MLKMLLVLAGTVALILGLIGIIVPGLPTTPFLLLAALLYARSSKKLHRLLTRNQYIGPRIEAFQKTGKLTLKTKACSISTMWIMILASCWFYNFTVVVQLILVAAGIIGTVVMGYVIPTGSREEIDKECAQEK
jgi:uncharacterized membrane protein YbaN (DUF454 family)